MEHYGQLPMTIVDNLQGGVYFVDKTRTIVFWNKEAERISGFRAEEVAGKKCAANILTHVDQAGNKLCQGVCPLGHTMNDGEVRNADIFLHHKDGHRVPVSVRVAQVKDDDNQVIGGVELFMETSNKELLEMRVRELEMLAMRDHLTGLPNRNFVDNEISLRFTEFQRLKIPFGVFFIDIDHFKQFNDLHGHDTGDAVLKYVANTFAANSRSLDTYARWGGEEFIAIIRNCDHELLVKLAEKMRILVENSYLMKDDKKLTVTISIGATMVHQQDTMESLIKRADEAMYESKKKGRNQVTLKNPSPVHG